MKRPPFEILEDYQEFSKYYWYRKELEQICRNLGIAHRGTKQELNYYIEQYFAGNLIQSKATKKSNLHNYTISLDSPLLECGFSFNKKYREYFSKLTNVDNFKFNADMATTWRTVKKNNDITFTIQDMLDVYYGKKEYAKYDNSCCEWNQFLKDFCADKRTTVYKNKIKVASILWREVRNSTKNKVYTEELLSEYSDKIKDYE